MFSEASCQSICAARGPRPGGSPKLTLWQWIVARAYHELARSGIFAANVKIITRIKLSDSALSQRSLSID